ncbi:hypothetical protein ACOMHN_011624 [Nucella lapillus]
MSISDENEVYGGEKCGRIDGNMVTMTERDDVRVSNDLTEGRQCSVDNHHDMPITYRAVCTAHCAVKRT